MSVNLIQNHYAEITAFYALTLNERFMNTHSHGSCEIMYVLNGKCEIYIRETEHRILEPYQFIFLDMNVPHRVEIHSDHPCTLINLEFACRDSKSNSHILEFPKVCSTFDTFCHRVKDYFIGNDTESLGYALKDLITRLKKTDSILDNDRDYLIHLLFDRVMLELSLCYQKKYMPPMSYHLRHVCKYIQEHFTEEIRITDLASAVGIHKSYLQSLFSQYLNCTIVSYINQLRLDYAVFLLENSDIPITEITFTSGFNTRQHFTSTFKKAFHMSPSAYRQLHQNKIEANTGSGQCRRKENGTWEDNPFVNFREPQK